MHRWLFGVVALLAFVPGAGRAEVALWSLENAEGGQAYLMGTNHLLPDDKVWHTSKLKAVLKRSEKLVLEAVHEGSRGQTIQAFALGQGFLKAGASPLSHSLDPSLLTVYNEVIDSLNFPRQSLEQMQPWFASLNLSLVSAMRSGFDVSTGAEAWLKKQFRKSPEPIGALEETTAGLLALAALPVQTQRAMLTSTLKQIALDGQDIRELFAAWCDGDMKTIESLVMNPEFFQADVHDAVVIARNKTWVDPISAYLKTPDVEFIAVGTAHLVGPQNLIDLLRAAGVNVTRLH